MPENIVLSRIDYSLYPGGMRVLLLLLLLLSCRASEKRAVEPGSPVLARAVTRSRLSCR